MNDGRWTNDVGVTGGSAFSNSKLPPLSAGTRKSSEEPRRTTTGQLFKAPASTLYSSQVRLQPQNRWPFLTGVEKIAITSLV